MPVGFPGIAGPLGKAAARAIPGAALLIAAAGLWDWWFYIDPGEYGTPDHTGFTARGLNCGGPEMAWSTAQTTAFCNANPVFFTQTHNPAANIYTTFYDVIHWSGTTYRGRYAETYDRNVGYTGDAIGLDGSPNSPPLFLPRVPTLPEVFPGWDPFLVPPAVPLPAPQPVPYRAIPQRPVNDPWRAPGERPEVGPAPTPTPRPRLRPRPRPRPGDRPSWDYDWRPGERPRPGGKPGFHRPQPPGKGEKEEKWNMPPWLKKAWDAAMDATEVDDFVDALFDALPDDCQAGARGTIDKMGALYRCAGSIDPWKAVANVIGNAIEDGVVGPVFGGLTPNWGDGPRLGPHGAGPKF